MLASHAAPMWHSLIGNGLHNIITCWCLTRAWGESTKRMVTDLATAMKLHCLDLRASHESFAQCSEATPAGSHNP